MNLQPIHCQPVFLIGAARSGTKFVRDLIAADPKVREIPFDINFVWRRHNESYPHDGLPVELATEKVIRHLRKQLPRMARAYAGDLLLEKTVSNALRIPFIRKVFPEAKFIHLIRDGRSVVESVFRVWDLPTPLTYKLKKLRYFPITDFRYASWFLANARKSRTRIWGPRYEGIDADLVAEGRLAVCGHQWRRCVDDAMRDLVHVRQEDKLEIRYEDLVHDRNSILQIIKFLQVAEPDAILKRYDAVVSRDNVEKWRFCWDESQQKKLRAIMGDRLEQLGYGGQMN